MTILHALKKQTINSPPEFPTQGTYLGKCLKFIVWGSAVEVDPEEVKQSDHTPT
jgi:hypothetical protein